MASPDDFNAADPTGDLRVSLHAPWFVSASGTGWQVELNERGEVVSWEAGTVLRPVRQCHVAVPSLRIADHITRAGFHVPVLSGRASSWIGVPAGDLWLIAIALAGLAFLLVLLTRYLVARRGAAELERLVRERTRQLRESSEQYRSLVQNAVVGIFRATPDGRIITANPALRRILCCRRDGDILRRNLRTDVFTDPAGWPAICRLGEEQGRIKGIEAEWRRCDGKRSRVRLSGRWVVGTDGQPVCELIAEDITEVQHAREAELEAERLRGVQKLAIAVAHEFNNPLSILLGTYQLYVEPSLEHYDPDVRERLSRFPETISRMRDLVTRLLRITRLREIEYIPGTSYLSLEQSAQGDAAGRDESAIDPGSPARRRHEIRRLEESRNALTEPEMAGSGGGMSFLNL